VRVSGARAATVAQGAGVTIGEFGMAIAKEMQGKPTKMLQVTNHDLKWPDSPDTNLSNIIFASLGPGWAGQSLAHGSD
jgi:hypothetical protein